MKQNTKVSPTTMIKRFADNMRNIVSEKYK